MTALTTRQRDLLNILLNTSAPIGSEDLAADMGLTSRQINYGLKGVKNWLLLHNIELEVTPGVGIELNCSENQLENLRQDLASINDLQLILSAGERQQLLTLVLLVAEKPMYLSALERLAQVSRSTVSKDLDAIEAWISHWSMTLIRRPNFGIEVGGSENMRQELISALLWGETPFGKPLTQITHTQGLVFTLQPDSGLHPLVKISTEILQEWDLGRVFGQVAYAEAQLGGRFTDDAVLHLALVFALQTNRIAENHHREVEPETIHYLKKLPVWDISNMIAKRLGWRLSPEWWDSDVAGIAMRILSAPRNERWPGDLDMETYFNGLIIDIMNQIAGYYDAPEMSQDRILHDGLVNQIIPACLRQKFDLWQPFPDPDYSLSEKYTYEHKIAQNLSELIEDQTGFQLPDAEINSIAMLLRAARIRVQPYRFQQVIVVCPSGMATAQLLVARLEARFPRLGPLNVVSLRELSDEQLVQADLIISTIPLVEEIKQHIDVIQVHPLLLPEDVEAITQYLT